MNARRWLPSVAALTLLCPFLTQQKMLAQAPASVPAGSTGQCKDGTYSNAAKKEGACRGHKGVQTWYVATTTPAAAPSKPSPAVASPAKPSATTTVTTPPTKVATQASPMPTAVPQRPTPAPSAAPTATNATAATASSHKGPAAEAAARTQAPGGGPGMVWVNTESKVYHCPGTTYYGKTKDGKYMSEADAKAMGAHADRNKPCTN